MTEQAAEAAAPVESAEGTATLASGPVESAPVAEAVQEAVKQNPAWAPILEVLPKGLHALVEPKLKEWDQGVSKKFEEAAAQRKAYENYQEFVDSQVDPEMIRAGISLLQQIQTDPRSVYDQMGTHFEFNVQTGEVEQVADDPYADPQETRIKQLEEQLQALVSERTNEITAAQQAENDKAFEQHLTDLETEFGEYDREYVLTQMAAGISGPDAVKAYKTLVDSIRQDALKPAPVVIGGGKGGSAVTETPDTGKMTPNERKNYVAQLLGRQKQNEASG